LEFLRHEEITSPEDLETITRAMWVVEVPDGVCAEPVAPVAVLTGRPDPGLLLRVRFPGRSIS
jgi:hypothetical protein